MFFVVLHRCIYEKNGMDLGSGSIGFEFLESYGSVLSIGLMLIGCLK